MADPYRYFRPEAAEIIERLGQGLLELEKGAPSAEVVPGLLRLAHTLKGAARVVRQTEIAERAHHLEDVLEPLRRRTDVPTKPEVDRALALVDEITRHLASLETPAARTVEKKETTPSAAAEEPLRTVRTDITELDVVLDSLSELSVRLGAIGRSVEPLQKARHLAELLAEQLSSPRALDVRERNSKLTRLAEELRLSLAGIERGFASSVETMERELRQARGMAEQLRLFPASSLFPALRRTARDLAQSQDRQLDFHARGGEVRIDAHVLAALQPALVQLVRNAVVHGIEDPAERQKRGKPPAGNVTIEVLRQGRRVLFRCRDDGRGVDLESVRRVAADKGLLAGTESQSAESLLQLLLKGGVTTSGEVNQASGRGIGLDVVREATSRLGGDVSVHTQAERGTMVELTVPVSLASVEALLVETRGVIAAVPVEAIREAVRVTPRDLARTARGLAIVHQEQLVPFIPLSRPLGLPDGNEPVRSAVVIRSQQGVAAVGVDRLVGTESLVVRPLPPTSPASAVVSGAAFDSQGTPQLVLDPEELVLVALGNELIAPAAAKPSVRPVLIIDDSLTTRMLEQSILESAGYQAHVAASAEEGMEMARRTSYSLFLVDIEMPGMDGFTFVERTRADPALRDTPSILVTSRNSPGDRQRGKEAGASAYIVKSEFDQSELLQIIRNLVS